MMSTGNLAKRQKLRLLTQPGSARAFDILQTIDRHTLGQLLKGLRSKTRSFDTLEQLLWDALQARNCLLHAFYRKHNFRRNSEEGRKIMIDDLNSLHDTLLDAYKAVLLLSGVDLEAIAAAGHPLPIRDLPI
jgi:hypothetical protein